MERPSDGPMSPARAAQKAPETGVRAVISHLVRRREAAIFLALVIMMVTIGVIEPNFVSASNLHQVSRQIAFVAMLAIGQLFVILHGGIDLSVGSLMALGGMVTAYCLTKEINPAVAALIGTSAGLFMGCINGALVAFVRIAPFIVTLGMLSFASGLVLGFSKGVPITEIPESVLWIAQGELLGLPVPVWLAVIIAVIAHVVLTTTAFGRRVYAMGGNEQATFLSGINVARIKLLLYMISAGCASLLGIVLMARFNSAQADTGKGWELDAIAAAVIGGTSLAGGSGSVLGVLIGACIISFIRNGLVIMKISSYWHTAVIGVVIVLAAVLDRAKRRS